MAENIREDKTARHLDHLSEALDSGTQNQVRQLRKNLSAAEIGDPDRRVLAASVLGEGRESGVFLVGNRSHRVTVSLPRG